MNMEDHFSEKEIKHMRLFLKRHGRMRKTAKILKWMFIFSVIFLGVMAVLNFRMAADIGRHCGIYSCVDALSFYYKGTEFDRTYAGCEVKVLERISSAHMNIALIIIFICYAIGYPYLWRSFELLNKCWKLLSVRVESSEPT